jgi:predicted Abi (CAAX) family protease
VIYSALIAYLLVLRHRLTAAICTWPRSSDWLYAAILLTLYSAIYLPIGFSTGFLTWQPQTHWANLWGVGVGALVSPSLTEELVFRVLLIPHRTELLRPGGRWLWLVLSLIGFIIYHPLNPGGPAFFNSPIFLWGAGLLGLICSLSYFNSGSLWTAVGLHWAIVVVWLLFLGGLAKF